ncbi:MAG: hypothetical protein GY842_11855 [bacterium]|nr:hypothetical protein [bacterium]
MPAECPNCRKPVARTRLLLTSAWGRWHCPGCDALLGINVGMRLLGGIPWVIILFVLLKVFHVTSYGMFIAVPILMCAAALNFFLFDRAVVHERTGFRCRTCGYDLQGQKDPRCPECGAEFDMAELDIHRNQPEPRLNARALVWRRWAIAILIGLSTLALIGGILFLKASSTGAAAPPPANPPVRPTSSPDSTTPAPSAPASSSAESPPS